MQQIHLEHSQPMLLHVVHMPHVFWLCDARIHRACPELAMPGNEHTMQVRTEAARHIRHPLREGVRIGRDRSFWCKGDDETSNGYPRSLLPN